MTTPIERTRAVLETFDFLRELSGASGTTDAPTALRRQAIRLLRHYPSAGTLQVAHLALPNWFASPSEVGLDVEVRQATEAQRTQTSEDESE
jgi:hypothetical protein